VFALEQHRLDATSLQCSRHPHYIYLMGLPVALTPQQNLSGFQHQHQTGDAGVPEIRGGQRKEIQIPNDPAALNFLSVRKRFDRNWGAPSRF
jgi:hypothetical protein